MTRRGATSLAAVPKGLLAACLFTALLVAVPVNVTLPSVVVTEISVELIPLVVVNSDFTLVVIHASPVSLVDELDIGAVESCAAT